MKKLLFTLTATLFFISNTNAQTPFVQTDLDINNVRATILTHGDMFWDRINQTAAYEFPKGSGKHSDFATSIWVSGYDSSSNLHVSAQTYRQSGNDYWPGPIDYGSQIDSATSTKWDKIWKVNKSEIDLFLTINPHTVFNTPTSILDWPAKGNPYAFDRFGTPLTIAKNMAPFIDVNNDGIYNALDGDYPKIKGEQALWWIFNDQKIHTETGGLPFNFEFKAMAYACNSIPALQNSTYYSFDITNYSSLAFSQTRIGLFSCADLGYAFDDYIGVDTSRKMGYIYNGDNYDDGQYDSNLTKHGLAIIHSPQDSIGYKAPLGSFTFFYNVSGPLGSPNTTNGYNNYMRGLWSDAKNFTTACNARDTSGTIITNYIFPGNPVDSSQWSEKQCNNTPSDRVLILSTSDFTFLPGETKNFTFAAMNTPFAPHTFDISELQSVADTVMMYPNGCGSYQALTVQNILLEKSVDIYPNPTHSNMTIQWNDELKGQIESLTIVNAVGQQIFSTTSLNNNKINVNTNSYSDGMYFVHIQTKNGNMTKRFVKN